MFSISICMAELLMGAAFDKCLSQFLLKAANLWNRLCMSSPGANDFLLLFAANSGPYDSLSSSKMFISLPL